MRVIFLGTPEFAVPALNALCASRHTVAAAVSQPDRETDRKGRLLPTPVKSAAAALNLPVYQYRNASREGIAELKKYNPDACVTAAFGQLLSREFLDMPARGVFNIHASLLPLYRGSSPIRAAILNGDDYTGVTVMRTELAMDTGDIVTAKRLKIELNDDYISLSARLAALGAELIVDALNFVEDGSVKYVKQDGAKATYTKKTLKSDGAADFSLSAEVLSRQARAFNPWPALQTSFNGVPVKIYKAEAVALTGGGFLPGTVLKSGGGELIIACGAGALKITELQAAGKKRMGAAEFLRGFPVREGTVLG
ncbi:MAG: methionyl-tRNA formyltransferase [Clostridiales bacterium]|jgi:methionyl-tRNA formyltransferase|nr:methionyl-tRNA formyltransferase [Clostridiales bacterium]